MKRIWILAFLAFLAMGCGGCSLEINSLVSVPQHFGVTMTGVTLSWPVLLGLTGGLWLWTSIKRWIRNAAKDGSGKDSK